MLRKWLDRWRARRLFAQSQRALHAGQLEDAELALRHVLRLIPSAEPAWFNLGLIHKWRRQWPESLDCCRRAVSLWPGDQPAWWNLGIAATALGEWAQAREAWSRYGLEVPAGDGPIEMSMGAVPIRLDPLGDAEVVWCRRLDPARAVIESVPLPESGRRCGDLLLHDGQPVGHRRLGQSEVPVFNEIEILERSVLETAVATVTAPGPKEASELVAAFDQDGLRAEDWTAEVRMLCHACSEGRPHDPERDSEHERSGGAEAVWECERSMGFAAHNLAEVEQRLQGWVSAGAGRSYDSLELHARTCGLH